MPGRPLTHFNDFPGYFSYFFQSGDMMHEDTMSTFCYALLNVLCLINCHLSQAK